MTQEGERFSKLPIPIHKVNVTSGEELFKIFPALRHYFASYVEPADVEKYLRTPDSDIDFLENGGFQFKDRTQRKLEAELAYCHTGKTLVQIFKYIMFVYDPDSDIIYEYPEDIRLVKDVAAKEAGFKRKSNGEWPNFLQKIMNFEDRIVTQWIMDYLKFRKKKTWTEIKILEEEIDFIQRNRVNSLLGGKVLADSSKLAKERQDELKIQYKIFYAEHRDLEKQVKDDQFPITPENVFKVLNIPDEVWKVRQVKDVPAAARPQ